MVTHRDDTLRADELGGQDRAETNRAVADDDDAGAPFWNPGTDGSMTPRPHHTGEWEERVPFFPKGYLLGNGDMPWPPAELVPRLAPMSCRASNASGARAPFTPIFEKPSSSSRRSAAVSEMRVASKFSCI